MTEALVVLVILNTNRRADTCALLASLERNDYPNCQVIVLDNASTDGSVAAIRSSYPAAQIIELDKNLGYAGNNNVGIKTALLHGADWVFVLNEDTILAPDCISELVNVGQSNPSIGIVGPMVYHHDEPGVIQSAGGKLGRGWKAQHIGQNEMDHGQFSDAREVDWISGCAILVRRDVVEQVGMLDERFFYYWEETEWCLRAREGGWRITHVPQARIWHKGVQRAYHPSPNVTYYATRNRFLMLEKHHAPILVWLEAWQQTLRTLVSWSIKPKWREMLSHRDAMWQGVVDFLYHRWGMRST
ncbi:MAG: glycosyltransferase family 2 protein [Chloroflexi bacterium]|nr:glycosyltransferase family 2 protein [Chloroflexota bacterium]MCL5274932.1 glycosyltransferase family 2 protein [Chloroflexota bacterium]